MSQNVQYDNDGNVIKKKFEIKIAGFTLGKKFFILVGVIIAFVLINTIRDKNEEKKRLEAERIRVEEALKAQQNNSTDDYEYDFHAEMQKSLTEQYGEAPEGFEWDFNGNLVALGNDEEATAEDTVYMYLRALSILDFSTAARYSENSSIISSYEDYYSEYGLTDYYSNFLRKQFKKSLTSLEIDKITDTAVFADGTKYITLSVNILDLTDKDFWLKDEENLWNTLRTYKETEEDSVKLEQYVYDYIYDKYEDGTIGKRSATIELVVSKKNGSGWLVSGDTELNAMLQYESGVDVARYILDNFSEWYQDTIIEEQIKSINEQVSDIDDTESED